MYHNCEILVNSGNQNPNDFQVKLPKNMDIHPNTEVAITQGKYRLGQGTTIDSTNDTFILGYGSYGLNDLIPEASGVGVEWLNFLLPQVIKLKHGKWDTHLTAGDHSGQDDSAMFGDLNMQTNLVDSLNEQSKYFMWAWAGKAPTNSAPGLYSYIPVHESREVVMFNANINTVSPVITYTAPAGAAGFTNVINNTGTNSACVALTTSFVPYPYSYNVKTASLANPQVWYKCTLNNDNQAVNRIFGGLIADHQYTYRTNEPYNEQKDFLKISRDGLGDLDIEDTGDYENGAVFGWELDAGLNICFFRREINEDGSIGNYAEYHISNQVADLGLAGAARAIEFRPVMEVATNTISNFTIEARIDGAQAQTVGGDDIIFTLTNDSRYSAFKYRGFVCNDSANNAQLTMCCQEHFEKNKAQNSIGTANQGQAGAQLVNAVAQIYPRYLEVGQRIMWFHKHLIGQSAGSLSESYASKYLRKTNASDILIGPDPANNDDGFYRILGDLTVADPVTIRINTGNNNPIDFHVEILNLPIQNKSAYQSSGRTSNRVLSVYRNVASNNFGIIDPTNIIYHKLENKQVFMLDHLRIRVSNDDGAIFQELVGNLTLNVHIKTNAHAMLQAITGAIRNRSQNVETVNVYEDVSKASQRVF